MSTTLEIIAYLMALADFVQFEEPLKFHDVDLAIHASSTIEHNEELSIPVEPVMKVVIACFIFES